MDSKAQRVIVVTGSNKGIGYYLVEALLKQTQDNSKVVLTSRDVTLGQKAVTTLLEGTPEAKERLVYHQLDINDDKSVDEFLKWAQGTFGKIDVLVNNAGVYVTQENDYDYVIGTNFLKTRTLTNKALPHLSDDGKIINVSSGLGEIKLQGKTAIDVLSRDSLTEKDIDELASKFHNALKEKKLEEQGLTTSCYGFSKALLNAWTHHVSAKQVKGTQQTYAVCPGWCRTDMGGQNAERTAEKGADSVLHLVNLPYKRDEKTNGKFFRDGEVIAF